MCFEIVIHVFCFQLSLVKSRHDYQFHLSLSLMSKLQSIRYPKAFVTSFDFSFINSHNDNMGKTSQHTSLVNLVAQPDFKEKCFQFRSNPSSRSTQLRVRPKQSIAISVSQSQWLTLTRSGHPPYFEVFALFGLQLSIQFHM